MAGRSKILDKPRAFVYRAATHNIPTGVATAVIWDTVARDVDGMWSIANPTRLTARTQCTLKVTGWVLWPANAASFRQLSIMRNGVVAFTSIIQPNTVPTATTQELTRDVEMNAGDYVELGATQNTGGVLTLPVSGSASTYDHGLQVCLLST